MDANVTLHPWEVMSDRIGPEANNCLTLLVHQEDRQLRFDAADCGNLPHPRVGDTIVYLRHLHAIASAGNASFDRDSSSFLFQTDDNPVDVPSASWEKQKSWNSIELVPDIYYYQGLGYEAFLPDVTPWDERDDQLLWRGSSTGILGLTLSNLSELPRYRLCQIAAQLGDRADCGFTGVVQGITAEDNSAILARLNQEQLMRDYIHTHDMQRARYAIDIDGNANSWNFIQRLRLGACMLRVESGWCQWFEAHLRPWQHYVPIKADLSNLAENLDWCRTYPSVARDIARAGRDFAIQMSYSNELAKAAKTLFPLR